MEGQHFKCAFFIKQDHRRMNVAPEQTIIFLDHLSSFVLLSFCLSVFCLPVSISMLHLSKVPIDDARVTDIFLYQLVCNFINVYAYSICCDVFI